MPHRIGKHEDIGLALTRLAAADLAEARASLGVMAPPERCTLRVRRRLKRVRSVLRVLRPALGAQAPHLAGRLREAAGLLAETRDTDAAAASARTLMAVADSHNVGLERVVAMLDREAEACHAETTSLARVDVLLAAVERDILAIDEEIDGADLIGRAIDRAYRRGRNAMRRAAFSLATPDLHAWRKAVDDLWHLIRIARKRLPESVVARAARLKKLAKTLDLDQDHAMLAERLALSPEGDPALMKQLSLIADQRLALEGKAFALGARLYKQKPKKFRRQIAVS